MINVKKLKCESHLRKSDNFLFTKNLPFKSIKLSVLLHIKKPQLKVTCNNQISCVAQELSGQIIALMCTYYLNIFC